MSDRMLNESVLSTEVACAIHPLAVACSVRPFSISSILNPARIMHRSQNSAMLDGCGTITVLIRSFLLQGVLPRNISPLPHWTRKIHPG